MKVTTIELSLIQSILTKYLNSENTLAFAFGSRVAGSARADSDLDLMLRAKSKVEPATLSHLKEEFENSNLPFKVDLIDESAMSDDFKAKIKDCLELIPF